MFESVSCTQQNQMNNFASGSAINYDTKDVIIYLDVKDIIGNDIPFKFNWTVTNSNQKNIGS